jgi:hypothetical protein
MRRAGAEAEAARRPLFFITTAPGPAPAPLEPLTARAARDLAQSLEPQPYKADRAAAAARLAGLDSFAGGERIEFRWLSDGVADAGDGDLLEAMRARGAVAIFDDLDAPKFILRPLGDTPAGSQFLLERLHGGDRWTGAISAVARDGRELARAQAILNPGERQADVVIDLPLALRNEIATMRVETIASAGAVHLVDARDRRALVGLVAEAKLVGNDLLAGGRYLREALSSHAEFLESDIDGVLEAEVSAIILDDIGVLRASEVSALEAWVEKGGVLIRFAGPVLAETAQDGPLPLLPAPLRGGGRAFGGALTWDTPQRLDAFSDAGPFAGLAPPEDVLVRRQVLAEPGGETAQNAWARLADGTPLVTGVRRGAGVIALFHVTSTPDWSDLPLSGVFIDMLKRLAFLSSLGPDSMEDAGQARFAPLRLIDGFGRLRPPPQTARALSAAELAEPPGPERPPGLYGAADTPLALNAVGPGTTFSPIRAAGLQPYAERPLRTLSPPLFAAALLLLLIDGAAILWLGGKLRFLRAGAARAPWRADHEIPAPRRAHHDAAAAAVAAALVLAGALAAAAPSAQAQPLDADIVPAAAEAALATRLAYVKTGDPATDLLSEQGLAGLSRELYRRTALEPAPPVMVDPETDDLSVYPFLYWPIVEGAAAPSETALANIENFMRFGGLILFDTRDDERAFGAETTPEGEALRRILSQLNIPPLAPVGAEHVLTRSFYLVSDLTGRVNRNAVWVQAQTSGENDDVTALIIGGRDWAGAWASDRFGAPVKPIGAGRCHANNVSARECAYRAGVNIVMVAFTGNYKSDQVHVPILMERLGR